MFVFFITFLSTVAFAALLANKDEYIQSGPKIRHGTSNNNVNYLKYKVSLLLRIVCRTVM